MTLSLPPNDTISQFYDDKYPGTKFDHLDKALLHSTETRGWPGYSNGASAPNVTYHPRLRLMRTHFSWNRSSRALRNPDWTPVRENDDNVFQLEIIAYSDFKLAQSVEGLWIGNLEDEHYEDIVSILNELNRLYKLPLKSTVIWKEGQKTPVSGVRLTSAEYDAYSGILAHMHASGNTHWDVGGFYYSKLADKLHAKPRPPIIAARNTFEEALMSVPTLKKGSRGVHVNTLQGLLLGFGYNLGSYGPRRNGIDGRFGSATDLAVRHFQAKNRVPNSVVNGRGDGVVGEQTRIYLNRAE